MACPAIINFKKLLEDIIRSACNIRPPQRPPSGWPPVRRMWVDCVLADNVEFAIILCWLVLKGSHVTERTKSCTRGRGKRPMERDYMTTKYFRFLQKSWASGKVSNEWPRVVRLTTVLTGLPCVVLLWTQARLSPQIAKNWTTLQDIQRLWAEKTAVSGLKFSLLWANWCQLAT